MTTLNVLSRADIKIFENPPQFQAKARKRYFALPEWAQQYLKKTASPSTKIGFVLQLGYFKATSKFFSKQMFQPDDIQFVSERLGITTQFLPKNYDNVTVMRHRRMILRQLGYRPFSSQARTLVKKEADLSMPTQMRPKELFSNLIKFLDQNKIEVPSFDVLAKVITEAFRKYEKQLVEIIENTLTADDKRLLDDLLAEDEIYQTPEKQGVKIKRYNLTRLKRTNHSTRPAKIKKNIEYFLIIKEKFLKLKHAPCSLKLSPDVIQRYATIARKAQIFQIARRDEKRYLYLLSFIIHQYYTMQDLFIDILLQSVQRSINHAKNEQKTLLFETRKTRSGSITNLVDIVNKAREILGKQDATAEQKLQLLQALFFNSGYQGEKNIDVILSALQKETAKLEKDEDYFDALEVQSLKLQNRVSEIVKQLEFNQATSHAAIIGAINYFKLRGGDVTETAPVDFLEPMEQDILYDENGKLRISLYKILLFMNIFSKIKSGELNLTHSYKYRSFDEYLIPRAVWEKDKEALLQRAGLTQFVDVQTVIKELKQILHKQYNVTNRHIIDEKNVNYKAHGSKRFSVATPKEDEDEEAISGISDLFPKGNFIPLGEVLASVNNVTGFLDALDHVQITHIGSRPEAKIFYAGIMGLGLNIGIKKIARISTSINPNSLETAVTWYFSPENFDKANDLVLSFADKLGLIKLFEKDQEKTYTSSDGQKYPVSGDSLNANYSFKYFGKDKGVNVYCFIDEAHRLFYSTVVSSSERDAAYVIDGLMYDTVVKSNIHSTDTHGYSETIFGTTHLLDISFAPRIKDFQDQTFYAFEKRKVYEELGFPILPDETINIKAFAEQWDQILRFIATIKVKETTASQLFRRLSSYSKQHPLYKALKAFGQIIKSLFLLRYIDDVILRQAIEKQLNKLESANKFLKAVFYGQNQEFAQETKEEQLVAEGCKRLIANAIILWNYLYLSEIIANMPEEKRSELYEQIRRSSIVYWQHINLLGEFDFSDEKLKNAINFSLPKALGQYY